MAGDKWPAFDCLQINSGSRGEAGAAKPLEGPAELRRLARPSSKPATQPAAASIGQQLAYVAVEARRGAVLLDPAKGACANMLP